MIKSSLVYSGFSAQARYGVIYISDIASLKQVIYSLVLIEVIPDCRAKHIDAVSF